MVSKWSVTALQRAIKIVPESVLPEETSVQCTVPSRQATEIFYKGLVNHTTCCYACSVQYVVLEVWLLQCMGLIEESFLPPLSCWSFPPSLCLVMHASPSSTQWRQDMHLPFNKDLVHGTYTIHNGWWKDGWISGWMDWQVGGWMGW